MDPGTLYVVATPIGNLEDITLRALRVLKGADLIVAEGVEHTRALCRHFDIGTRVSRYNQHNQKSKGPELLRRLSNGESIALVSNAGTPGVADPGVLIARQALEAGIRVVPVPGPSAVTAALSIAGLRSERFLFVGFLAGKAAKRRRELKALSKEERTMVFYEAPHRVREMLGELIEVLGEREIVLVREMTKVHEEVIHGKGQAVLGRLKEENTRGEFTLVVAGRLGSGAAPLEETGLQKRIEKLLDRHIMSVKDAARRIAEEEGLPWRKVYRACLFMRREREESGD